MVLPARRSQKAFDRVRLLTMLNVFYIVSDFVNNIFFDGSDWTVWRCFFCIVIGEGIGITCVTILVSDASVVNLNSSGAVVPADFRHFFTAALCDATAADLFE